MTLHGSDTTPQNAACDPSPGREDRVDLEPILHFNLTSSPPATVLEPPTTLDMEHPLFNNDERSVFGDYSSFFYQNDGFGHAAPYANMAVNDDTRWRYIHAIEWLRWLTFITGYFRGCQPGLVALRPPLQAETQKLRISTIELWDW